MFLSFLFVTVSFQMTCTFASFKRKPIVQCPTIAQMAPCRCEVTVLGRNIFCRDNPVDEIGVALANVASTNQSVLSITVEDVWLPNLPPNFLMGHDVYSIIIRNCSTSSVDEDAFADMAGALQELRLTHSALDRVPSRALEKLSKLWHLDLSRNKIEILHAEAFKGLKSLQELLLNGNSMKFVDNSAFLGIAGLSHLYLGDNELTAFPRQPLGSQINLFTLELNNNKIATLVPEDFDNSISDFFFDLLLANNSIRHLPAGLFRSLQLHFTLNLSGNGIESIHPSAFEGAGHVVLMDLSFNRLQEVPIESLRNLKFLKSLDLSSNKICQVRKDDFLTCGIFLNEIMLQNNSITHLHQEAFKKLYLLKRLYLGSNKLKTVTKETLDKILGNLEVLELHDNPLHCDCNLSWYQDWMSRQESKSDEAICVTPPELANGALASIPPEQLVCGNSTSSPPDPCCNCNNSTDSDVYGSLITYLFPILL